MEKYQYPGHDKCIEHIERAVIALCLCNLIPAMPPEVVSAAHIRIRDHAKFAPQGGNGISYSEMAVCYGSVFEGSHLRAIVEYVRTHGQTMLNLNMEFDIGPADQPE